MMGNYFGGSNSGGGSSDTNTILNGVGAPSAGLGDDGDFYIDTAANEIYGPKTAGAWGSGTSLIGPTGPAGGNVYMVESRNVSAPNASVPSHNIVATGSETNIDAAIVPKGTGAFQLAIPDNGTTGGNKRGTNAVDLQTSRNANSQVASGLGSFTAGMRNTASNNNTVAMGTSNGATGVNGVALGSGNTASGLNSFAAGGSNIAGGTGSTATGLGSSTGSIAGRRSHSSGIFATIGDSQYSHWELKAATTNATPTALTMAALAASATSRVLLPNNTSFVFSGILVGKQQGSTNSAAWEIKGLITRGTTAASTVIIGTPTITAIDNSIGWGTPTITADTTNGCLIISVIGVAATNIRWDCLLSTAEITYA